MKGSQLAAWCERVGYNAGMVAYATRQIESAKQAILPRADARAGEEKSATVFKWSDDDAHITISGPSTHELHGFYDQEQPEVTSVDQSNQQYSILALTDSSGNVSERYAYTAYGQPTFLNASAAVQTSSAASNRYTYTAREWDATLGLHHFRARWMSGLTGRFLSRDPIGYRGSPFDLYEYCEASPLQNFDPLGMETWVCSGQMSNIKTFTLEEVDKDGCTMTSKITLYAQRCFRDGLIGSNDIANFYAEIQFNTTITRSCPCQPSKSWKTYRYCQAPLGVFIKPTLDDYGRGFDPKSTNVDDFRDAFCPGVQTLTPG